jgi:hypothetical protein
MAILGDGNVVSSVGVITSAGSQQRCYLNAIAVEHLAPAQFSAYEAGLAAMLAHTAVSPFSDDDELTADLNGLIDACDEFLMGRELKRFFEGSLPTREVSLVGCIAHFIPGTVNGTIADLVDDYLYGASPFSAEFDERLRVIREKTLMDAESGISQLLASNFEEEIRVVLAENAKATRIPVPQKLGDDDMRILRDHFPRYELRFTQHVDGPHNMAAAHRVLEVHELVASFPQGQPLIDIGGNWFTHFRYGRTHVHSCCPLLDLRDNERQTTRMVMLESLMSTLRQKFASILDMDDDRKPTRSMSEKMKEFYVRWSVHPKDLIREYKRLQNGDSSLYCHDEFGSLSAKCRHQAKYGIMVHSGYDIDTESLVMGMQHHGIEKLKGTLIADPAMLVNDSGCLTALKCRWEKKNGAIWFSFVDDSTMGYRHDWKIYSAYLTQTIIPSGNDCYVMERDKYRHGILSYTVTRCSGKLRAGTHAFFHNAWFAEMFDKYIMKVPDVKVKDFSGSPNSVVCSWRNVIASRKLIDRVIAVCLRGLKNGGEAFNCKANTALQHLDNLKIIQNHLLSHSQTLVLNGATIIREEAIPFRDFSPMSLTIYFEIMVIRYKEGMAVSWFNSGFDDDFMMSFFSLIKEGLSKILGFPKRLMRDVLRQFFPRDCNDLTFITEAVEKVTVMQHVYLPSEKNAGIMSLHDFDDALFFETIERIVKIDVEKDTDQEASQEAPKIVQDTRGESTSQEAFQESSCDPRTESRIVEVVSEATEYSRAELNRIQVKCDRVLRTFASLGNCSGYQNDVDALGLFTTGRGWVLKPDEFTHEMGWNGIEFVTIEWTRTIPTFVGETLVVSENTKVMTNYKLGRKYNCTPKVVLPRVSIIDGVTGCGKTTEIVQTMTDDTLILSVCKANVLEIRKKVPGNDGRIRTLDSYLLNPNPKMPRLFLDEFGLAHPGYLLLAMSLSGATEAKLFGDTEQIPFCNRVADFRLRYPTLESTGLDFHCEVRTLTYRCPKDITYVLGDIYQKKAILTASSVVSSISIKEIKSENEIPHPNSFDGNVLYIAMTKHDVSLLKLRWAKEGVTSEVRTVHAAQGLSYPHVVYFRLMRTDNDLYTKKKSAYHLVAISRHTTTLVYCTTKPEDPKDFSLKVLKKTFKASKGFSKDPSQEASSSSNEHPSTHVVSFLEHTEVESNLPEPSDAAEEAANINFPVSCDALYVKDVPIYKDIPDAKGKASHNPAAVAMAIEELTPGNTTVATDCLDDIVELSSMSLQLGKLRWDLSKISPRFISNPFAEPCISTGALPRRNVSSKQVGAAIEKRNANCLNSCALFKMEEIAEIAVSKFFKLFIDPVKFLRLPSGKLGSSAPLIQLYQNKTGNVVSEPKCLALTNLSRYNHMIKRDVKPVLTTALQSEYTKAATITYHKPDLTQVATAIFGQFKTRLLQCRASKVNFPLDHDSDLSGYLTGCHLGSEQDYFTEIDFSKFDKSQGEVHQIIQDKILLKFGVDPEFVALWSTAHRQSSIFDQGVGIGFKTDFQRRTGDAFTFLGNTLVTAAMLAYVIDDFEAIRYILVGGDDSLICSYRHIEVPLEPLESVFNMSCKLIQPACPYFASRYLIRRGDEILCVPDPYKLLVKMGRKDIPDNEDALEEVRKGLADSAKYLFDDEVKLKLSILVQVRYNKAAPSLYDALCFVHWALATATNFKTLFNISNKSHESKRRSRCVRIR